MELKELYKSIDFKEKMYQRVWNYLKGCKYKDISEVKWFPKYQEEVKRIEENHWQENIIVFDERKCITYEDIEERLRDKKLEDYTDEDVFERYYVYGDLEEFEDVEIQKLMLEHNYVEELIHSVPCILTDKEVVEKIMASRLGEEYILRKGKIQSIEQVEISDWPKGNDWLIFQFSDEEEQEYEFKSFYAEEREKKYKEELESNIGQELYVIMEWKEYEDELHLVCFMK